MANYSRQRELLEQLLAGTKEHPTAMMLYAAMRKVMPNVSLATVYRNLKYLEEEGRLIRVPANQPEERYDGNVKPHPHFVCDMCDSVYDISVSEELDGVLRKNCVAAKDYSLVYFGRCASCRANSEKI